MLSLITPQSLKDLVEANAIRHATVIADKDVYKITVKYGTVERLVSVRTRGGQTKERIFASLDSVARFMRQQVHLTQYEINDANFQPGTKRVTRPDISVRMRDAHAALTHAEWVKEKVSASRAGLADGSNKVYTEEEWAKIRAAKVAARQAAPA
jgi:mannose/fructose/N-acetylgalactosamine-specific phosphotransferase system component IIB